MRSDYESCACNQGLYCPLSERHRDSNSSSPEEGQTRCPCPVHGSNWWPKQQVLCRSAISFLPMSRGYIKKIWLWAFSPLLQKIACSDTPSSVPSLQPQQMCFPSFFIPFNYCLLLVSALLFFSHLSFFSNPSTGHLFKFQCQSDIYHISFQLTALPILLQPV